MAFTPPHLLICDDGSRTARHALQVAAEQFPGARVTILGIETPARNEPRVMERHAIEAADLASQLGLRADWLTRRDDEQSRPQVICDVARERHADLIVIGTSHMSGFKAMLLGSIGSALARTSHLPVLCVPDAAHDRHPRDDEHKALLCFDASAASRHAVDATARLLVEHDIVVLTVWNEVARVADLLPGDSSAEYERRCHELDERDREAAAARAEAAAERLRSAGLTARSMSVESGGAPWWPIDQTARAAHADIVVLGSRGLFGLRAALDSTSRAVLAHMTCPVLLVPEPPPAQDASSSTEDDPALAHVN